MEFKQLNIHAWEAFDKGQDIHMQAAPSQAELLYKNYKVIKENLKSHTKETILEKYGNAASEKAIPRELLLGQSEREVEYDRAGRIIKGQVYQLFIHDVICGFLFCNLVFVSLNSRSTHIRVKYSRYLINLCLDWYRKPHFPEASMKKMFISTTTLVYGVHGGRIINGDTDVVSSLFETAIV